MSDDDDGCKAFLNFTQKATKSFKKRNNIFESKLIGFIKSYSHTLYTIYIDTSEQYSRYSIMTADIIGKWDFNDPFKYMVNYPRSKYCYDAYKFICYFGLCVNKCHIFLTSDISYIYDYISNYLNYFENYYFNNIDFLTGYYNLLFIIFYNNNILTDDLELYTKLDHEAYFNTNFYNGDQNEIFDTYDFETSIKFIIFYRLIYENLVLIKKRSIKKNNYIYLKIFLKYLNINKLLYNLYYIPIKDKSIKNSLVINIFAKLFDSECTVFNRKLYKYLYLYQSIKYNHKLRWEWILSCIYYKV